MKEKMHFEIDINNSVQKVWDTMLTADSYKEWTSVFDPTSHYEGSWDKGSTIKFLGADGGGMLAEIVENIPYEFISIKHVAEMSNGVEKAQNDESIMSFPIFENYTLTENGTGTHLVVDMEMHENEKAKEMREMYKGMWPNALLKLKEICER